VEFWSSIHLTARSLDARDAWFCPSIVCASRKDSENSVFVVFIVRASGVQRFLGEVEARCSQFATVSHIDSLLLDKETLSNVASPVCRELLLQAVLTEDLANQCASLLDDPQLVTVGNSVGIE